MTNKILFLAANPRGITARRLDEEARDIQEEIRRATQHDQFEFVPRLAARPMDLLRALREVKPSIVHVVGHEAIDGLHLVGDNGQPLQVTSDALHATFGAAGRSAQIVVLNGCATEDLAEALCDFVPVCVGTPASAHDDAVRAFSIGFYGALASSESAARARRHGEAAIRLAVAGDRSPTFLHHRHDIDPEALVLPLDVTEVSLKRTAELAGASPQRAREVTSVIERYRKRKSGSFERCDLRTAGPTPTMGNRPAEITLDEMYIPLQLAPKFCVTEVELGAPICPDDLLGPYQPRVMIGPAGSGKTTWMRWTFRRLIRDPRAIPFFLELRAIAAVWKTPHDAARPIEGYLADALAECGAADPDAVIAAVLADESGPRPVILIDGWDELGSQGERPRERLVELCRAYPHIVVVVSSRPYGDSRPAGVEAFETLYIQPLSDHEVWLLTSRFHLCVHGRDEPAARRATDDFVAALNAVPDARSLAGTALLLTMMLLLSREGPLPDRRHKLYTACLRNMLLHRVTQRERDGVVLDIDQQWRPDDSEERLRVVAALAYRMQTQGYKESCRAPVVRAWDEAVALLGGAWPPDECERFLRWLVASAGVLLDRTDGSIQFAHLSFQEHLTAYFLFISREGEERVAAARSHMSDRDWWETLRLWAGLLSDQWPDRLAPVLDVLSADPEAYWLAGLIFADGAGRAADFELWIAELPARLSDPFTWGEDCARAWGACKQEARRAGIASKLAAARDSLNWLHGTWLAHWCDLAKLDVTSPQGLVALEGAIGSAPAVARSRVLHGASVSWPDGRELAMLRLWPSTRLALAASLQTAVTLGAEISDVLALLPIMLGPADRPPRGDSRAPVADPNEGYDSLLALELERRWNPWFGPSSNHAPILEFGRYFGSDLGWYLDWHSSSDSPRNFIGYFVRHFLEDFARYFARDFVREYGRLIGRQRWDRCVEHGPFSGPVWSKPWASTLAVFAASSASGHAAPRSALARGHIPKGVPLLAMLQTACRAGFAPDDKRLSSAVARACDRFDGDVLWPALARHIARLATADDRALLADLARHPEKRTPPLSWGLQYYVRGDLVLDGDTVITLDELCAQAQLTPPPLLDHPDEDTERRSADTAGLDSIVGSGGSEAASPAILP